MSRDGHQYAGRLKTEGNPDLAGTFVMEEPRGKNHSPDRPSIDGKFNCPDLAGVARILASGNLSMLEDNKGNAYVVKLLDSAGLFHVVAE
jgi:hypothetical protein